MKIDAYCHILPVKYAEALYAKRPASSFYGRKSLDDYPALTDLDTRFRIMDKYEGLVQVLSLANPLVEDVAGPKDAVELAKLANDELAELVLKYPDRFPAAVAWLPMNNMEAVLTETDRAIKEF